MPDKDEEEKKKPAESVKPEKGITVERIAEIGREVGRKHLPRQKRS